MNFLPKCIIQYIFNKLPLRNQLRFMQTCKKFNTLKIYAIIYSALNHKLTDNILLQSKFSDLQYLDIKNNIKVSNINHLVNLQYLNCSNTKGIYNLNGLNLKTLIIKDNLQVIDVNHMTNLRKLVCSYNSSINNLKGLQLEYLDISYNSGIFDISHMTNLKTLKCVGKCSIIGFNHSNLTYLNINNNCMKVNLSKMPNLRKLKCAGLSIVTELNTLCDTLEYLDVTYNSKYFDVSNFKKLKILKCTGTKNFKGIDKLNLEILYVNNLITEIPYMSNLQRLYCTYDSKILNWDYVNRYICCDLNYMCVEYIHIDTVEKLKSIYFKNLPDLNSIKKVNIYVTLIPN